MRAYRPGRVGSDEFNKEFQGQRLEKIDLYALRAENGLPLFGSPKQPGVSLDQSLDQRNSSKVS